MAQRSKLDPLDEADDALAEMKRLGGEEEEEDTGRVNIPSIHIHAPHPSSPEIQREPDPTKMTVVVTAVKRMPPLALAVVIVVLGLAALGAYTFLKWSGKL